MLIFNTQKTKTMKDIKIKTYMFLKTKLLFKNTTQQIIKRTAFNSLVLFLAPMVLLSSCDNFLDVEPYSTISPDTFLTNEINAESALTGVYNALSAGTINGRGNASSFRRGMLHILNSGTDETVGTSVAIDYFPLYFYTYNPGSNFGRDAWLFLNAGISRANFLLESLEGIKFEDPARKEQVKAEARFLRAVYYQYLAYIYGAVPIKLSTADDRLADAERKSLQEVYAIIEADLLFAHQTLNETSNRPGTANKFSAAGFLSKMYTYLASCKENNVGKDFPDITINSFDWVDSDEMYKKAYDINTSIIGKKALTASYFHLFRTEKNASTYDEVLFGVEATDNQDVVIIYVEAFIPQGNSATVGGGFGGMRPGQDLVNKYDKVNDVRFKNNITGNLGGNPALLTTEILDGTTYYVPFALPATIAPTFRNLCIGKWRYPKPGSNSLETWASDCNFQLIRYADILLLQAELEFKHKKNEDAARGYLKMVRERATEKNAAKLSLLTTNYFKADFMTELMDERSRELCFETWRRIDLIRTGTLKSTLNSALITGNGNQSQMSLTKANFQPFHIWYPIPVNEFINKKMVQNSGY